VKIVSGRQGSDSWAGGGAARRTYHFGGATVTEGATVAFGHQIIGQPGGSSILYHTASDSGGCPDIIQSHGTTPPLDSVRRDSAGLQVTSMPRLRGLGGNGAAFGLDFDSGDAVVEQWGTISLTFAGCDPGREHYNSTTGFGSGVCEIVSIYNTEQQMCP